jgi:hypothetical protein
MKYDVTIGPWRTRVLQGVTHEALGAYCAARGLHIVESSRIGLTYCEVRVSKFL